MGQETHTVGLLAIAQGRVHDLDERLQSHFWLIKIIFIHNYSLVSLMLHIKSVLT